MKKILMSLLVCGSILTATAQEPPKTTTTTTTTTTTHKYYYYPSQNVYYDQTTGDYWYMAEGASEWTKVQALPSTIVIEKTPQFALPYQGTDPWKNNAADIKKYKVKKNGEVKIKTKD